MAEAFSPSLTFKYFTAQWASYFEKMLKKTGKNRVVLARRLILEWATPKSSPIKGILMDYTKIVLKNFPT